MCVQDILAFYITNKLQNVEGFSFRSAYILNPSIYSVLFAPIKTQVHVWLHLSKSEQDINSNINFNLSDNLPCDYTGLKLFIIYYILHYLYIYIYIYPYSLHRRRLRLAWEKCIYLIELPVTQKQFRIWSLIPFIVRFTATEFETGFSSEGLTHLPRFPAMTFTVVTQYSFRPQGSTGVNPTNVIKTHLPLDKKPSLWQTTFSNLFFSWN